MFRVTLFALLIASAMAACPNRCSGHGECGSADKCSCQPRWTGADCSLRECPFGLSWTAEGSGVVPAGGGLGGLHPYSECSSKGTCDRSTGECVCFPGYEGRGCRRHRCPNDCSGNGRCVSNAASSASAYSADGGAKFGSQYWDANSARVCECDRGWEGYDCSSRICPKGDDPVTDCSSAGGTATANSLAHTMVQRLWVATTAPQAACIADGSASTGMYADMTGKYRLDQTVAYSINTADHKFEVDVNSIKQDDTDHKVNWCSLSLGDTIGKRDDHAGFHGSMCSNVPATAASGSTVNAFLGSLHTEPWIGQGTGGAYIDATDTHSCSNGAPSTREQPKGRFNYFGYISLKYTDMFGGEYFTRPILIDVSDAATQDDYNRQPEFQWETTKDELYHQASPARANNASPRLKRGTCSKTHSATDSSKTLTRKNCIDAGGTFTEDQNGFYLGGAHKSTSGQEHSAISADKMKGNNLKRYTADRIRDALQDLPNFSIPSVNVTNYVDSTSGTAWGNAFDITFTDQATSGKQNLLECIYSSGGDRTCAGAAPRLGEGSLDVGHGQISDEFSFGSDGSVPVDDSFSFQAMGTRDTLYGMIAQSHTYVHGCTVHEVSLGVAADGNQKNYEENSACSNRGLCDGSTGLCDCFDGHTGENCSVQTIFF